MAAVLAGVAAYVFWGQLDEMQAEQRAWLNPNGFELSLVTINNQPAIYAQGVTENTGHSVATETIFSTKSEAGFLQATSTTSSGANFSDICEWDPKGKQSNIYPSEKLSYERLGPIKRIVSFGDGSQAPVGTLWDGVKNGRLIYYVRDCVTYTTMGKRHYRQFCFYAQRNPVDGQLRVYHCPIFNKGD